MIFKVGDTVVYPHHGAALIEAIETRTIKGEQREYLVLKVSQGDLTVRVPADNAEYVGVRDVVGQEGLDKVFQVLRAPHTEEPTNWSRRYKANLEKLASGDVNKVAEVVRDLWRRDQERGLSAGEKRMLAKARQILVGELALAENTDHAKAEIILDEVLAAGACRMITVAVVPAAGSGDRLAAGAPKAFVNLAGRPMLEHALDGLRNSGVVDSVVVAVPPNRTDQAKLVFGGAATIVAGGSDRTESVRLALEAVGDAEFVLIHDAARALTPPSLIARVVAALHSGHPAVVPALPVSDTIKAVDANGVVLGTPERAGLRAVQTAQGFRT